MLSRHSLFSSDWFRTVCRLTTTPQEPQKTPCKALRNTGRRELLTGTTMYFSSHGERELFLFS